MDNVKLKIGNAAYNVYGNQEKVLAKVIHVPAAGLTAVCARIM